MTGIPDWRPTPAGVEFVGFAGRPLPSFPVAPGSDDAAQAAVRLLEELWGRNLLAPPEDGTALPWMSVYELDSWERRLLGLPEPNRRLRATVATDRWLSHRDFRIRIDFSFGTSSSDYIPVDQPEGLLFESPAGRVLPPREVGEIILLLDGPMPGSAHERGILIAKLKRLAAQSTHIALDHYLQNEDYVLPRRLDLEVESVGPAEIRLQPTVEGVDVGEFRGFVDGPPQDHVHPVPARGPVARRPTAASCPPTQAARRDPAGPRDRHPARSRRTCVLRQPGSVPARRDQG